MPERSNRPSERNADPEIDQQKGWNLVQKPSWQPAVPDAESARTELPPDNKPPKGKKARADTGELSALLGTSLHPGLEGWCEIEKAYLDMVLHMIQQVPEENLAHIARISRMSRVVAEFLSLSSSDCELIGAAAPFHDLGKIGVPRSLLKKHGPRTRTEEKLVQRHTLIGAALLRGSSLPLLKAAATIALCHHEHWDGTGYPRKLRGDDIPMAGRIVLLVDRYDILRSQPGARSIVTHADACDVLFQGNGTYSPEHFDPCVLFAFLECHRELDEIYRMETQAEAARRMKDPRIPIF